MRETTRRLARRTAYVLAAFLAFGLVLHSPPAKSLFRRLAEHAIASRTSAQVSIGALDYRLWRGEISASDVSWNATSGSGSVRAKEVLIEISLSGRPLIRLQEPEIEVILAEGAAGEPRPILASRRSFRSKNRARLRVSRSSELRRGSLSRDPRARPRARSCTRGWRCGRTDHVRDRAPPTRGAALYDGWGQRAISPGAGRARPR